MVWGEEEGGAVDGAGVEEEAVCGAGLEEAARSRLSTAKRLYARHVRCRGMGNRGCCRKGYGGNGDAARLDTGPGAFYRAGP